MKILVSSWFYVRLVLTLLSIPIWLAMRSAMSDDFSQPPKWYFIGILVSFSLVSVFALSMLLAEADWRPPSWFANPFDKQRPPEGLHLAGWSLVFCSTGLLIAGTHRELSDWSWVLPGCVGLGLLLGVRLAVSRNVP